MRRCYEFAVRVSVAQEVEEQQRVAVAEAELAQEAALGTAAAVRVAVDETRQSAHVGRAADLHLRGATAHSFLLSGDYKRGDGVEEGGRETARAVERQAEVFAHEAEVAFDLELVSRAYLGAQVFERVRGALRLDELAPELVVALGEALHYARGQHDINTDAG